MTLKNNHLPDGVSDKFTAVENVGNTIGTVGNEVRVYRNEYDANRLHVAVYNQAEAKDVNVSVPFADGSTVNAYNAQDMTDIQRLTVKDGAVSVTMSGTVASPVKWNAPASTFPQFGCFVMERQ